MRRGTRSSIEFHGRREAYDDKVDGCAVGFNASPHSSILPVYTAHVGTIQLTLWTLTLKIANKLENGIIRAEKLVDLENKETINA